MMSLEPRAVRKHEDNCFPPLARTVRSIWNCCAQVSASAVHYCSGGCFRMIFILEFRCNWSLSSPCHLTALLQKNIISNVRYFYCLLPLSIWVLSLVSTSGSILVIGSKGLHRFVGECCRSLWFVSERCRRVAENVSRWLLFTPDLKKRMNR